MLFHLSFPRKLKSKIFIISYCASAPDAASFSLIGIIHAFSVVTTAWLDTVAPLIATISASMTAASPDFVSVSVPPERR
jgi:hypothetical protein